MAYYDAVDGFELSWALTPEARARLSERFGFELAPVTIDAYAVPVMVD